MLRELRIREVAIIDEVALSFGPGLNVISGETGAGKSILLQSLALLCGARGSADLIRADADEAVVEGLFDCAVPDTLREALGLDDDGEVLVRRHLARSGKGRIYVNGAPVTLALLAQLGDYLVHIYGQHEQAVLLRPANHLELLDRFADLGRERAGMADAFAAYAEARRQRDELSRRAADLAERRDLLEFQQRELSAAAPLPGEEASLRQDRELLRHAERIETICREGEVPALLRRRRHGRRAGPPPAPAGGAGRDRPGARRRRWSGRQRSRPTRGGGAAAARRRRTARPRSRSPGIDRGAARPAAAAVAQVRRARRRAPGRVGRSRARPGDARVGGGRRSGGGSDRGRAARGGAAHRRAR